MVNNYSFSSIIIKLKVLDTVYNLTQRANGDININQRDSEIFSKDVKNDGQVIFSKRIDRSGSAALTYSQVSSVCNDLDNIFKQLEDGIVTPKDLSMEVFDTLGNRQWEMSGVGITKPADEPFGQMVSDRTYSLIFAEVTKTNVEI